jgi:hypothetical protein
MEHRGARAGNGVRRMTLVHGSQRGSWALYLVLVLALGGRSAARAQACAEELRTLQALRQQVRAEVVAGNTTAALTLASRQKLERPPGYDYEGSTACQKWALEVANVHRASCSFERAREQLVSIKTEQPLAIDSVRSARERLSRSATAPLPCQDKKNLYLLCQPISDTGHDAWCVRSVEHDDRLEFPRDAWCKLVDEDGFELSTVNEGSEPTCREELEEQKRSQKQRVRAERRGAVAEAGSGIALLAAIAIPVSFVPQGTAKLLRRLDVIDKESYARLRHRSFRARQRVLPLLGVTALSVSALSSRFWWAGLLTAGCGVTADVMLAQHWHHPDKTRRSIGIATASLAAVAGLALNLETLGYSDTGSRYAFMPTLRVGVAQAELGLAGQF